MVQIKELEIGTGIPKICVPIVETTQEAILDKAQEIVAEAIDLIEWRIDFYEDVFEEEKVIQTADLLQSILGKIPLLVTFRTAAEGGERAIDFETYANLLCRVANEKKADLIDVEVFWGYDLYSEKWSTKDSCNEKIIKLVENLSKSTVVIGSYHDFQKTPKKEEIAARLAFMDQLGVAIPKMAVMPQRQEDVLVLMEATLLAKHLIKEKPVITMSMGELGKVSRLAGESFSSAVTFACLGRASAPGQVAVTDLKNTLKLLHTELVSN